MTENQCGCGQPAKDAYLCTTCAHRLDDDINAIAEPQGLAWDLQTAYTRQVRLGERNGSRSTETTVPYDSRAKDAATTLDTELRRWAGFLHRATGHTPPPPGLAPLARWIRPRIGWLRYNPSAATAYDEITTAVRAARRAIDRPTDTTGETETP